MATKTKRASAKQILNILTLINGLDRSEAAVFKYGTEAIAAKIPFEHRPFMTLIALLLSSQTQDKTTHDATLRLYSKWPTCSNIINNSDLGSIEDCIKPVNFYRRKAANVLKIATILGKLDGEVPDDAEVLMELPGIGPKMAHLALQIIHKKTRGISVDTHVHRVTNRIGLVSTKTPEDTMVQLEECLPRKQYNAKHPGQDLWRDINPLLVSFGQTTCTPLRPKCHQCPLNRHCMYYAQQLDLRIKQPS